MKNIRIFLSDFFSFFDCKIFNIFEQACFRNANYFIIGFCDSIWPKSGPNNILDFPMWYLIKVSLRLKMAQTEG